jgi:hypothetical protein
MRYAPFVEAVVISGVPLNEPHVHYAQIDLGIWQFWHYQWVRSVAQTQLPVV